MSLDEAKQEAKKQGDASGMMTIVYESSVNGYGVAHTLPMHGRRIYNYYPAGYTCESGFYLNYN